MNDNSKDNLFYNSNKITFDNAKALRKTSTETENILWEMVRGRKFMGLKFRRQHPIGRFIADFYCHDKKFVIEVDGSIHNSEEQREYDAGRTYELNENGIQVIRFTNNEIEKELQKVLTQLKEFVENKKLSSPHPLPLSPKERGDVRPSSSPDKLG